MFDSLEEVLAGLVELAELAAEVTTYLQAGDELVGGIGLTIQLGLGALQGGLDGMDRLGPFSLVAEFQHTLLKEVNKISGSGFHDCGW
jgi:hypothetical protein